MNPLTPRTLGTAVTTAALLVLSAVPAFAAGGAALVEVDHDCTAIEVSSTKAISNVVLQFADGDTQRFEDLPERRTGTFAGTGDDSGEVITTAWVKSGNNTSGDGPGYGERFDFDTEDCEGDSSTTGATGTTGTTGDGGSQGTKSTKGPKGPKAPKGPDGPEGPESDVGSQAEQNGATGESDNDGDSSEDDAAGDTDTGAEDDDRSSDVGNAGADAATDNTATGTDQDDADTTGGQPDDGQVAAAGSIRDARVLGLVLDRGPEDGLRAADASDVSSAGLPTTGADAVTALAAALAALGLGGALLRRTRGTRRGSA